MSVPMNWKHVALYRLMLSPEYQEFMRNVQDTKEKIIMDLFADCVTSPKTRTSRSRREARGRTRGARRAGGESPGTRRP